MSGRIFLDTNVLVYTYSHTEPIKQAQAQALCLTPDAWVSTQVLIEFTNVYRRRFQQQWADIERAVEGFARALAVHPVSANTIRRALQVAQRYGFSWFDSLIVAAALECGCQTLYSEDLHGQVLEGTLRVVNPFI